MKILITSPDAIIDKETGKPFEGVIDALNYFLGLDKDYHIAVISAHNESLKNIPPEYSPMKVGIGERGGRVLVDRIRHHFGCGIKDFVVLGCKDHDMFLASHSKLLLLRAGYAKKNNPTDRIYTHPYGRNVGNGDTLYLFFEKFLAIKQPWYYELKVTEVTSIYALTNANTFTATGTEKELNEKFKACLKEGNPQYRGLFLLYSTVCSYFIANELEKVDYFAVYPSSTGDDQDLFFFKESIREAFGNRNRNELFIRHKQSIKRHGNGFVGAQRVANGCNNQFETMHVNPYFRNKLKNKIICVVDDFTTYGTSCETVRHLLEPLGVARIIFIALGKFGKEYHAYSYFLKGDVFTPDYTYQRNEQQWYLTGTFNSLANKDFVDSLSDLTK